MTTTTEVVDDEVGTGGDGEMVGGVGSRSRCLRIQRCRRGSVEVELVV